MELDVAKKMEKELVNIARAECQGCTAKYSGQLYHKFDNAQGSDYARSLSVELVGIARAGYGMKS